VLDRWQKPGDFSKFARFTVQPNNFDASYGSSDAVYSDGSFIRLRNLSIAYDFPQSWAKKAGMQGCKIYFRGENLFVITKFDGVDPETGGFGTLPLTKYFTGGIQFNF